RINACAVPIADPGCLVTLNGLQAEGKYTELRLVLNDLIDDFRRDLLCPRSESVDQCSIAKNIDRTWNPVAGIGNDPACIVGKEVRMRVHCSQTKIDVFADFIGIQWPEMEIRRNPLRELQKLRRPKQILQLRLANEYDLQELLLIRVDVG